MADRANVLSIEEVDAFRTALTRFTGKAGVAVDEMMADVHRTLMWLREAQPGFWQNQLRKRSLMLGDARSALNRARLSDMKQSSDAELKAVSAARRAVRAAEDKLRAVRHWAQVFDSKAQPHMGQLRKLADVLDQDMPSALTSLKQMISSLEAYAEITATAPAEPTPEAAGAEARDAAAPDAPAQSAGPSSASGSGPR